MILDHLEAWMAVATAAVLIVGGYFTAKAVTSNLAQEVRDLKRWKEEKEKECSAQAALVEEVKDLKRWKEYHEKDSARKQGEYEGKISSLEKQLAVGDYKFVTVAKDIDEIKGDMKTLLERRREEWERLIEATRQERERGDNKK